MGRSGPQGLSTGQSSGRCHEAQGVAPADRIVTASDPNTCEAIDPPSPARWPARDHSAVYAERPGCRYVSPCTGLLFFEFTGCGTAPTEVRSTRVLQCLATCRRDGSRVSRPRGCVPERSAVSMTISSLSRSHRVAATREGGRYAYFVHDVWSGKTERLHRRVRVHPRHGAGMASRGPT